jgi:2-oxoglutarate decarboxylase
VSTQATNSQENPLAGFGPNEWIVEDMYQRYLADPASVDSAWHDFFADYKPAPDATPAPAAAAEPAPAKPAATKAAAKVDEKPVEKVEKKAVPATKPAPTKETAAPAGGAKHVPLRGVAARIVQNMDASLEVPTATSVRAVPAKLLSDNRIVINNHLARGRGGKVSFTHLIGSGRCPRTRR